MRIPDKHKLARIILGVFLAVASSGSILTFVVLALCRISYPFELEWMEGGTVDHVVRILDGKLLYAKPSLDFVAYIYTPLYFYVSAAVSALLGVGFLPMRIVSLSSALGSFAVIFLLVGRETRSWLAGLVASGLFAATYELSGSWLDIARVDSLYLFLMLIAAYLIRFNQSVKGYVLAGVFASLAFLTKQAALAVCLPMMLGACALNWRLSIILAATFAAIVGGSTLVLDHIHDGWYTYYVFYLPRQHELIPEMLIQFWTKDLLVHLPIACLLGAFFLVRSLVKGDRRVAVFYLFLTVGMVGSAWLGRLHHGGHLNVLIPGLAMISVLVGLVMAPFFSGLNRGKRLIPYLVVAACLVQFVLLKYDPARFIPDEKDLAAGNGFIQMVSQIEGEVLIPYHGYLSALAGKKSYAHKMALGDVVRGDDSLGVALFYEEIEPRIRKNEFAAIILDASWYEETVKSHYSYIGSPISTPNAFYPVTGYRTRPEYLFVPSESPAVAPSD